MCRKASRPTSQQRSDPVSCYLSHGGFIWESHPVPDLKHRHMINSAAQAVALCLSLGAHPRLKSILWLKKAQFKHSAGIKEKCVARSMPDPEANPAKRYSAIIGWSIDTMCFFFSSSRFAVKRSAIIPFLNQTRATATDVFFRPLNLTHLIFP